MRHRKAFSGLIAALVLVAGGTLPGCSGGGTSAAFGGFQLLSISVPEGAVWPINKQIELKFSGDVDLLSIATGSTLQLASIDGSGADAFFTFDFKLDPTTGAPIQDTIVLQPFCPLLADLSDAGFQPGGIRYQLFVPGVSSGSPFTIRSSSGAPLQTAQARSFFTPTSTDPAAVFDDTAVGPPAFVPAGTFVRLGDGTEIPFVFTGTQHDLPATLPLNLYSDSNSTVTYLVQLNQAVDPSAQNLSDDRVRIEFLDGLGQWQAFETLVELESNCSLGLPGALLKLTPRGILPQKSQVRVTIVSGFTDIVGEQNLSDQTDFFAPTLELAFMSLSPADDGGDELFEDFLLSGAMPGSFEDDQASFDTPVAKWENGTLTSAFDFQGTGGPGGDFDWHTPSITFTFSTEFDSIIGGPDGLPVQSVPVVGGFIDVDDMIISVGTFMRVQGTNPLTITCTGDLRIDGILDLSGFDAKQVGSLFTPNQPEIGSVGSAGGGQGGTGSFMTSASTPCGGIGDGPFGIANAGGNGGETGYDPSSNKQKRRGAGGGGGRFGADSGSAPGEVAQPGDIGNPVGKGAKSGTSPPQGGLPGAGPFLDGDTTNDFFGKMGLFAPGPGGALLQVVGGELATPRAGYGSGAGGDAIQASSFPTIPFGPPYKDKKGAGGGGGGGQLRIIVLGKVIFGSAGTILCDGGDGATGENVLGFDHIAGSSGGASGGHVIIESADQIDFTDGLNPLNLVRDYISAVGGIGGIPKSAADQWSGGGNGGPGVIQLHVPTSNPTDAIGNLLTNDIVLPVGAGTNLNNVMSPGGLVLISNFGARSKARSRWIPLGAAAQIPTGGEGQVFFTFAGTELDDLDPDAGKIAASAGIVDVLAPILPDPLLAPEILGTAAPAPFVDVDSFTLVLSQTSIQVLIDAGGTPSNDIYLRNPALLKNFVLRLQSGSASQDFDVVSATYADLGLVLRIMVDPAGGSLEGFVTAQGGPANVDYEFHPRFFRVRNGQDLDELPPTGFVRILFQAATALPDGTPDAANPVVDWTADPANFNAVAAGALDFFRFEVEFDLDAAGTGVGLTVATEPISIEFLRLPFGF